MNLFGCSEGAAGFKPCDRYTRMQKRIADLEAQLAECQRERHRLLVIATKWTDKNHHDWDELEEIETKIRR